MRKSLFGALALALCAAIVPPSANACHTCKKSPCVMPAPQPTYQCVTEMVPYTVMKTRTRVDYQPQTCTVMTRVPVTNYIQKTCTVMRPVYDTQYVTSRYMVSRPVYSTSYVTQNYTVCRPVTTTRQVTEYCLQPTSWCETVPVVVRSGGCCGMGLLCGKLHGGKCAGLTQVGCQTVTRTCYTPVPVVRNVVETTMVAETATRQVPVTTCRLVCEEKVQTSAIKVCRMVPEVRTVQVPVTTFRCEPKTITRMVPVCTKECVPVTCYRPVKRMVPVCPPVACAPVAATSFVAYSGTSFVDQPPAVPAAQAPSGQAAIAGPPPVPQK